MFISVNVCILIVLVEILVLIFIHSYLPNSGKCSDLLNKTWLRLDLRICFWNAAHIAVFFALCYFLKPISFWDHLAIFIVGVSWFVLQVAANALWPVSEQSQSQRCEDVSYSDPMKPKPDDFLYNLAGQFLYLAYMLPVALN
jgi:hypothetical protein